MKKNPNNSLASIKKLVNAQEIKERVLLHDSTQMIPLNISRFIFSIVVLQDIMDIKHLWIWTK